MLLITNNEAHMEKRVKYIIRSVTMTKTVLNHLNKKGFGNASQGLKLLVREDIEREKDERNYYRAKYGDLSRPKRD